MVKAASIPIDYKIDRSQLRKLIGTISVMFTLLVLLHGSVMLPVVRHAVSKDIEDAIGKHEKRPHVGAVHRHELDDVKKSQERIEKKIDRLTELLVKP